MGFPSESVWKQCQRLMAQVESGKIDPDTAADRLLDLDPDFAPAYSLLGTSRIDKGDLEQGESWYWKGLELWPAQYTFYFQIAEARRRRDRTDMLAEELHRLGVRKLALMETIPPRVAKLFSNTNAGSLPLDFRQPAAYETLALLLQKQLDSKPSVPENAERLLPYRLLTEIQEQAPTVMGPRLLDSILANAATCLPVLHAAMREWAEQSTLSKKAACMVLALLGEIGNPRLFEDLLAVAPRPDWLLLLHSQWALWRLGQRFPEAALEEFRKSAKGASLAWRCALADQLGSLPDIPGVEPALLELLEGFPLPGAPGDLAYLLLAIAFAIDIRGNGKKAESLLIQYERLIPKAGRKALATLVSQEDGFAPRLIAEGLDQCDIREICIDRVLMDGEGEDSEEDVKDEIDDGPPAVKPGRNEPCWCGSGKKYKKCHLASDQEAARGSSGPDLVDDDADLDHSGSVALSKRLTAELITIAKGRSRDEFIEAIKMYFDRHPTAVDPEVVSDSGFWEWYTHAYRPRSSGRTAVEELLYRRGSRLDAFERDQLEAWRHARYGLFQVERLDPGVGVELQDLLAGDTFFVHDVSSSNSMVRWDCILTRVEELDGQRYFVGNGLYVQREILPGLLDFITAESDKAGQTPAEYMRNNSHRFYRMLRAMMLQRTASMQLVNFEGDPLEFSVATYELKDEAAVLNALRSDDEFEETTADDTPAGVYQFGWLEVTEAATRRSYGHVEISNGRLRLECNSRRRLQRGREFIEWLVGSYLSHLGDEFESVEAMKRRAASTEPRADVKPVPDDVQRQVIQQYKEEHYRKWPDEPLPALDGKTPRAAMKTAKGREAVRELLRTLQNHEERGVKAGKPAYDFSKLRESLGLTDN